MDETRTLQRCMRDLVALSALPSIWSGYESQNIVESFADILFKTLQLDIVYLTVRLQGEYASPLEVARSSEGPYKEQIRRFRTAFEPLIKFHEGGMSVVPAVHPFAKNKVHLIILSLDNEGIAGTLVVGSKSSGFPSENDRLLLNLVTNHATTLLRCKSVEQSLQRSQERSRFALDSAGLAEWDFDLINNCTQRPLKHDQLFGYNQLLPQWNYEVFISHVHPEDREEINNQCQRALQEGDEFSVEYRTIWPDETIHWLWSKGSIYRNKEGRAVRVTGVVSEITSRKKMELHLRSKEQSIIDFFENGVIGLHLVGPNGIILHANQAELDLLGYTRQEYVGHHIAEFHADESTIKTILERLSGNETLHNCEARLRCKDGSIRHVLISSNVLLEDGKFIHTRCFTQDITERTKIEQDLQEERRILEVLNRTGTTLAAELDLQKLLQSVTDAGTELSGAQFGAFFYNETTKDGEAYILYILSGVAREAFEKYPMPRNTALFGPTSRGEGVIRIADVLQDPRYGKNAPYHGMPKGHLPVRSYLAASVISRSGEVIGGLFFGHEAPGIFTERVERVISGIAAQAAIAIDNARLYQAAQAEVAERKQAEQALRKTEERLRAALFASCTGTFHWDIETNQLEWDDNLSRLLGLPEDYKNCIHTLEEFTSYIHPEDRDEVLTRMQSCAKQVAELAIEFRVLWPDQSIHWLASKGKTFLGEQYRTYYMTGACVDITERKHNEELIQQSEAFNKRMIESSLDCIKLLDLQGRLLYISEGGQKFLEIADVTTVMNCPWVDFWQGEDRSAAIAAVQAAKEQGAGRFIGYCPTQTGKPKWWEVIITPILDKYDRPEKLLAISRDITEHEQNEQLVRQAQEHAIKLAQSLTMASVRINSTLSIDEILNLITDQAREIIGAHQAVISMTTGQDWSQSINSVSLSDKYAAWRDYSTLPDGSGIYSIVCKYNQPMRMTQSELEAHPAWRGFGNEAGKHPPLRGWLAAPIIDRTGANIGLLQLSDKYEGEFTEEDEAVLVQLAQKGATAIANARLYEAVQQEAKQRQLSEQELQRQNYIVKTITDNAASCLCMTDTQGHPTFINPAFEEATGYTLAEIKDHPVQYAIHRPHSGNKHLAVEQCLIDKAVVNLVPIKDYEDIFIRKDGASFPVRCSISPLQQSGITVGAVFEFRDITLIKQAEDEIKNLNRHLEKRVQERTAALQEANAKMQEFNYTVSHDLRAPVRAMSGYAQVLEEDYGAQLDPQARDYLRRIHSAAEKMDNLIQGLLSYSRISNQEIDIHTVNLQELFSELLHKQQTLIAECNARIEISEPLPLVAGHYLALYQAIENLILNSLKFVTPGVAPHVQIGSQEYAGKIRLYIKDNGIGIAPEYHSRIFNIFERLHGRSYDGTGIGLTIVKKSVERMGGQITLDSDTGMGSTFWIELPKVAKDC